MPKRKLLTESKDLAEDIQEEKLLSLQASELESERAVIVLTFEEATENLKGRLTRAPAASKLLLEQQLEYEQTLYNDRLAALEARSLKQKADQLLKTTRKKRRRMIDKDLNDCLDIATDGLQESSWQSIRKVMHIKHTIEAHQSKMSEEQLSKYEEVLAQLQEQGFKVAGCSPPKVKK